MLKNGKKNNPSKIEVEMSQNILAKQISPKKGITKQNILFLILFVYLCEIFSHKS
jgi:hypothetical protein